MDRIYEDLGLRYHSIVHSPFNSISTVTCNNVPALGGSRAKWPWVRTLVIIDRNYEDFGLRDHSIVHSPFNSISAVTRNIHVVSLNSRDNVP
jgi:hypothetical protein